MDRQINIKKANIWTDEQTARKWINRWTDINKQRKRQQTDRCVKHLRSKEC